MKALFCTVVLILLSWHLKQISACTLQKWMELHELVGKMKNWTCAGRYYTPTDVQSNCTDCALQCFCTELSTVGGYCTSDGQEGKDSLDGHINNIQSLLSDDPKDCKTTPQPCHNCLSCEDYEEMPFQKYAENLHNLVKMVMDKYRSL